MEKKNKNIDRTKKVISIHELYKSFGTNHVLRGIDLDLFKGENLVSDFCKANASGSSDISITVNKELSASASGSSDVLVKGDGVIRDIKTSRSSRISKI